MLAPATGVTVAHVPNCLRVLQVLPRKGIMMMEVVLLKRWGQPLMYDIMNLIVCRCYVLQVLPRKGIMMMEVRLPCYVFLLVC